MGPVFHEPIVMVLLLVVVRVGVRRREGVEGGELEAAEGARAVGREPRENAVGVVEVLARQLLGLHRLKELLLAHGAQQKRVQIQHGRRDLESGDGVHGGLGRRQRGRGHVGSRAGGG